MGFKMPYFQKRTEVIVLFCLVVSFCLGEVSIRTGPSALASYDPFTELTNEDFIRIAWTSSEKTTSWVTFTIDGGTPLRVLGTDQSYKRDHEVTIGQFDVNDRIEYYVGGQDKYGNETEVVTRFFTITEARPDIQIIPEVITRDVLMPCEVNGNINDGGKSISESDKFTIINMGKGDAKDITIAITGAPAGETNRYYMCNEKGDCNIRMTLLGNSIVLMPGKKDRTSSATLTYLIRRSGADDITSFDTYGGGITLTGANINAIERKIWYRFVPEIKTRILLGDETVERVFFENACGNEVETLFLQDLCGAFDNNVQFKLTDNQPYFKLSKSNSQLIKGGIEPIDISLSNVPLPTSGQDYFSDTLEIYVGENKTYDVPVEITIRRPTVKWTSDRIKENITCGQVFSHTISYETELDSGCLRRADIVPTGELAPFNLSVHPKEIRNVKPGSKGNITIDFHTPPFIKSKTYNGGMSISYNYSQSRVKHANTDISFYIPPFIFETNKKVLPLGNLRSESFYDTEVDIAEINGGCLENIDLSIDSCTSDKSFLSVRPGKLDLSAFDKDTLTISGYSPDYIKPGDYSCVLRIHPPERDPHPIPITFSIPYPQMNITFPEPVKLYKVKPPHIKGKASLSIAEIGGYTPLKNITLLFKPTSCPHGTVSKCSQFNNVIKEIKPINTLNKQKGIQFPIDLDFQFSDPRGDYKWDIIINASNDNATEEIYPFLIEIVPPTCKNARETVKNIDEKYINDTKELNELLSSCDEFQKKDPTTASRIVSLISSYSVFSQNIETLNALKEDQNQMLFFREDQLNVPRLLSLLRSSERSQDGICSGIENTQTICSRSIERFHTTVNNVGHYFCTLNVSSSDQLAKNDNIANIFFSKLDKTCNRKEKLAKIDETYAYAKQLRQKAIESRLNPFSANQIYKDALDQHKKTAIDYMVELNLVSDSENVINEMESLIEEYDDFKTLWLRIIQIAGLILSLSLSALIFSYAQYRLKVRRIKTL